MSPAQEPYKFDVHPNAAREATQRVGSNLGLWWQPAGKEELKELCEACHSEIRWLRERTPASHSPSLGEEVTWGYGDPELS